jgi:gamma-glutamyl:cysteine ligase YbdK (ATP-grasp superfamily)
VEKFLAKFNFTEERNLMVGVERECFLTRNGQIMPIAPEIIPAINHPAVGYELSACQLEYRIGPSRIDFIRDDLEAMEKVIGKAEKELDFKCNFLEVAPDNMPLDIYPDPEGRYQRIAESMPKDVLLAACQVTGTHIHIGMGDGGSALEIYNKVIPYWERLSALGDNSYGKRLSLYQKVAPNFIPPTYKSWEEFHKSAVTRGFADNPRNCWDLIRISKHGTIEFRMFGSTDDLDLIKLWAYACYGACAQAKDWFHDSSGRTWSTRWHG